MFDICKCAKSGQRKPLITLNLYIVVKDGNGKVVGSAAQILKFWVIWVNTM